MREGAHKCPYSVISPGVKRQLRNLPVFRVSRVGLLPGHVAADSTTHSPKGRCWTTGGPTRKEEGERRGTTLLGRIAATDKVTAVVRCRNILRDCPQSLLPTCNITATKRFVRLPVAAGRQQGQTDKARYWDLVIHLPFIPKRGR